jgi:hypothetical protein
MAMFDAADRVLVAVMNNRRDFELARDVGWYRIPVKHAPESATEARVLGFYLTRAFDEDRWSVRWYAPVEGHELVRRRDLLPDEPDHPRAGDPYYKLQLGPLKELPYPIYSLRWRRITFIETTWDRFITAEEINDLYISGADGLYVTLKEAGLCPEREFPLGEGATAYVADLVIPCREGLLPIVTGEGPAPADALQSPDLDTVRRAVDALGGTRSPIRQNLRSGL